MVQEQVHTETLATSRRIVNLADLFVRRLLQATAHKTGVSMHFDERSCPAVPGTYATERVHSLCLYPRRCVNSEIALAPGVSIRPKTSEILAGVDAFGVSHDCLEMTAVSCFQAACRLATKPSQAVEAQQSLCHGDCAMLLYVTTQGQRSKYGNQVQAAQRRDTMSN